MKLEMLADVLDCNVDTLNEDLLLEELENWDSMNKLAIIVLMEDEFNKKLTSEEVRAFRTVGDVLAYMG